jgi:hypothetical protein
MGTRTFEATDPQAKRYEDLRKANASASENAKPLPDKPSRSSASAAKKSEG